MFPRSKILLLLLTCIYLNSCQKYAGYGCRHKGNDQRICAGIDGPAEKFGLIRYEISACNSDFMPPGDRLVNVGTSTGIFMALDRLYKRFPDLRPEVDRDVENLKDPETGLYRIY